jgi:hypothetical protein
LCFAAPDRLDRDHQPAAWPNLAPYSFFHIISR